MAWSDLGVARFGLLTSAALASTLQAGGCSLLFQESSSDVPGTDPDAVSVDFWFQTEKVHNASVGGLLTADGNGNGAGEMGIFIFQDDDGGQPHHVLLRLQDGAGNTYFGCSDEVALDTWHHVAVSFEGTPDGVKLFVNGVEANNTTTSVANSSLGGFTCGEGSAAKVATLAMNDKEWMWGASNVDSPNNVARDGTRGLIDELRVRTVRFTLAEAMMVSNSLPAQ